MLIISPLFLLPSCSQGYPRADGFYLFHSGRCDTIQLQPYKEVHYQFKREFRIKALSGFSLNEIDSIIIKSPTAETDSISILKLKHEKGEFISGVGRMTKWKPEMWISENEIPVLAESVPDDKSILRIVFKEKLSPGVYAICVRKYNSGVPETHYYDFIIK